MFGRLALAECGVFESVRELQSQNLRQPIILTLQLFELAAKVGDNSGSSSFMTDLRLLSSAMFDITHEIASAVRTFNAIRRRLDR